MEKNKRVIIYVLILLVGIGISFAYFVGRTLFGGEGAMTHATTASINNAEVTVTGNLEVDPNLGMLPGHKIVSHLEVTAKGDNILIPFNLIWKGTNGLETSLKVTVYKASKIDETIKADCEEIRKNIGTGTMVYEECDITNIDTLGAPVGSGTIPKSESATEVTLAEDQFINATPSSSETLYYYVILEYPNDEDSPQNSDMGRSFEGEVTVEASDIESDIDIAKIFIYDKETKDYKELASSGEIPENQILDMSKTTCKKGATPIWDSDNKIIKLSNYTSAGETCELYFKDKPSADEVLTKFGISNIQDSPSTFNETACDNGTNDKSHNTSGSNCKLQDKGVFKGTDDYGDTYYYRGTVDNNWVQFAGMWWRIIRINGNGTIRLIYSGSDISLKPTDGRWNTDSIIATAQEFNSTSDDNKYIGYMYGGEAGVASSSYSEAHSNKTDSDIKKTIDDWFKSSTLNNSKNLEKIDGATGFCNDRQPYDGPYLGSKINNITYGYGKKTTYYASFIRANRLQKPSFICTQAKQDLFTLSSDSGIGNGALTYPVGLITVDEIILAGGKINTTNYGYWLQTNQSYWTISPYYFSGSYALMFRVNSNGYLGNTHTSDDGNIGVRPVINLKADTIFKINGEDKKGTIDNPYVVEGAE